MGFANNNFLLKIGNSIILIINKNNIKIIIIYIIINTQVKYLTK